MTGLRRFLPKERSSLRSSSVAALRVTDGLRPLTESSDLPIQTPRDDWALVKHGGSEHIQREFHLEPPQMKMLVCEVIEAQEIFNHHVHVQIAGDKITIRSTTHEFGEPTERDREIARYIDSAYDEMRSVYK